MNRRATAKRRVKAANDRWRALWYRVRSEFRELPGMTLRVDQAARLFGLERAETEHLLERLVSEGFLRRTPIGAFALFDSRP